MTSRSICTVTVYQLFALSCPAPRTSLALRIANEDMARNALYILSVTKANGDVKSSCSIAQYQYDSHAPDCLRQKKSCVYNHVTLFDQNIARSCRQNAATFCDRHRFATDKITEEYKKLVGRVAQSV